MIIKLPQKKIINLRSPCTPKNNKYTNARKDIFEAFKEMKEMHKITKLLNCNKKNSQERKKCTNPLQFFLIINELDSLANELNLSEG